MALEKEFEWYLENQDSLLKEHLGKVLVIKDQIILGIYDSEKEAFLETSKKHKPGTFLVQECTPGEDAYTQTFVTRVIF